MAKEIQCKRGFYDVGEGAMEAVCSVDVPKAVDAARTRIRRAIKVPLGTDKEVLSWPR